VACAEPPLPTLLEPVRRFTRLCALAEKPPGGNQGPMNAGAPGNKGPTNAWKGCARASGRIPRRAVSGVRRGRRTGGGAVGRVPGC
jgi:hypothetical protein